MSTTRQPSAGRSSRRRTLFSALLEVLQAPANRARAVTALVVLVAMLALAGCTAQYPQTILEAHSTDSSVIALSLLTYIFWPALLVFVVVEGVLIYAIFRYRQRPDHARPEQVHGNTKIEIAWTIAPAVVLAFIAVPTVRDIFITQAPAASGSLQVHVTGHQWWWEFEYPELGVHTANEFAVPVGQTVNVAETSADVIHSFWVPAMSGKRDVVPNHTNYIWFTPARDGLFFGQCAEYCGDAHADMRLRMVAYTPDQFQQWVANQKSDAIPRLQVIGPKGEQINLDPTLVNQGEQLVAQKGCTGCHTIRGNPANGNQRIAPELTHVGSRTTIAAGKLENTPENIERWVQNPPSIKPGAKMPVGLVNATEAKAVAAYLKSLQ